MFWRSFFGLFFRVLHGCQTHDKRMAFMGHSLRAHAVLMLTHAFGALDLKQMALTSGSCGTPICTIPFFQILGLYVMFSLATLQFYFPNPAARRCTSRATRVLCLDPDCVPRLSGRGRLYQMAAADFQRKLDEACKRPPKSQADACKALSF